MAERSAITQLDDWVDGETQTFEWVVYASNGRAIEDITSFTIEFRLAVDKGGAAVLTKPMSLQDPQNGLVRVTITPADTAALPPLTYWYEVWRIDPGLENRLAHGNACLLAGVA